MFLNIQHEHLSKPFSTSFDRRHVSSDSQSVLIGAGAGETDLIHLSRCFIIFFFYSFVLDVFTENEMQF